MTAAVLPLDPAGYARHALHVEERAWSETNCYVDLWIELLHALGLDPVAALAFTVAADFEGDQWTFFKFPLADLYTLYGIDVQELNLWRPLVAHVEEQVALGRPVIVEVDAYYLPDVAGTSYRQEHVKTSIAAQAIDPAARRLGYFHNAGYYELAGDDFDGVFRLPAGAWDAATLPPYVELVKLQHLERRPAPALAGAAVRLLRLHRGRRPADNPFVRYRARLDRDLGWLTPGDLATFHLYAFSTLRQCGACFELTGTFLRWLDRHGESGLAATAEAFECIGSTAKAMQFKLARLVNTGRPVDVAPLVDTMAAHWDRGQALLAARYDG